MTTAAQPELIAGTRRARLGARLSALGHTATMELLLLLALAAALAGLARRVRRARRRTSAVSSGAAGSLRHGDRAAAVVMSAEQAEAIRLASRVADAADTWSALTAGVRHRARARRAAGPWAPAAWALTWGSRRALALRCRYGRRGAFPRSKSDMQGGCAVHRRSDWSGLTA